MDHEARFAGYGRQVQFLQEKLSGLTGIRLEPKSFTMDERFIDEPVNCLLMTIDEAHCSKSASEIARHLENAEPPRQPATPAMLTCGILQHRDGGLDQPWVCGSDCHPDLAGNAAMESFFSSLKTERTARKTYWSRSEAKADVFDYIERFYNPKRRHSTLGYLSPIAFERKAGLSRCVSVKPVAGHLRQT